MPDDGWNAFVENKMALHGSGRETKHSAYLGTSSSLSEDGYDRFGVSGQ